MKKLVVVMALLVSLFYVLETQDVVIYDNIKEAVVSIYNDLLKNDNPIFVGESEIDSTLSNPVTLAEVKATLTVSDLTDGDLTSSIVVVSDLYTGHEATLGDYEIVFSAADVDANITTFTVTVSVIENPVE